MDIISESLSTFFSSFNFWVVLGASVLSFVVGGIWYSLLFQKAWQEEVGLKEKDMMNSAGPAFAGAFVLSFFIAMLMSFFFGDETTMGLGAFLGLLMSLFVVAALGTNYLFERKSLRLFLINAGYNVVTFMAIGAALGQWL